MFVLSFEGIRVECYFQNLQMDWEKGDYE